MANVWTWMYDCMNEHVLDEDDDDDDADKTIQMFKFITAHQVHE